MKLRDDDQYCNTHIYIYEYKNELKGTMLFKDMQPLQIEIIEINENEIKFFAMMPAYTATVELRIADGKLSGRVIIINH